MWPKAFAQLIELTPHLTRLIPMADRFFQSKTAGEEANRRAMEAMAEGLRGDLGQVTASHSGLYRQLNEQSARISDVATDVAAVKRGTESVEARLTRLESSLARQTIFLTLTLLLLAAAIILLILILKHPH
jgi:septal ring factor EnvC (AmiA/AmiB activator)